MIPKDKEIMWHEYCQKYLELLYKEVKTSANYSIKETLDAMHEHISLTYGEISYQGVDKLFKLYPLSANDVFVDLGSGFGKMCVQIFLTQEVRKVVGIEVEPNLVAMSNAVVKKLRSDLPAFFDKREFQIIKASFLEYLVEDVTIVFICSLCFTDELMYEIGCILNRYDNLRLLISLKPIPGLNKLKFNKTVNIDCTWDSAICYIYTL